MGTVALIVLLLAAPAATAREGLAEIVQLQRSGRYEEAWERSVALYAAGRRDPVLVQWLQSLGMRLGRYDELAQILQLGANRELSVREQLIWADILLRRGSTEEGLAVLEEVLARGGAGRSGQVMGVLTARGMIAEALRVARQQREHTSAGDALWIMITRELASLSSREGLAADCVREAVALVSADSSSLVWAADQVARVPGLSRDMVTEAVSTAPASPHSPFLAATLLLKLGHPDEGLGLLREGAAMGPRQLLAYAAVCRAQGQYDTASAAYAEALASAGSRPDTMAALEGLMMVSRPRGGVPGEAADYARRLLALAPGGARASEAHLVLAREALVTGRPATAAEHARAARDEALGDQEAMALWLEAEALLISGDVTRASAMYAGIARQWPSDTLANNCLSRVSMLADSCHGVADFARGIGLRWQGNLRKAAESFSKAATSCSGSVMECEARLEAARCWLEDGDLRAAESFLEEAAEDTMCAAKSLFMLGAVLVADSRKQEAAQKLERLLLEFPDSPMVVPARRELGRIRSGRAP
jgi:tetratricopeptide (TPR) repeat protein